MSGTAKVPSTIEYLEYPTADLIILGDSTWCLLGEAGKLAPNTYSFSFVVNVDGIKDLSDEETSPFSSCALANMTEEESQDNFSEVHDEILQASLARTIVSSATESPVYRVSGSKTSSARPKANNRARKEVTQLEKRQYRHQIREAKKSKT